MMQIACDGIRYQAVYILLEHNHLPVECCPYWLPPPAIDETEVADLVSDWKA